MYDRILVPVDGSDSATAALDHALEIATDHDATVPVLYVADTNKPIQTRAGTDVVDVFERKGDEIVSDARERAADSDVAATRTSCRERPTTRSLITPRRRTSISW